MLQLAGIAVEAVSLGGVETCIQLPGLRLCLDMGTCPQRAVRHPLVLFTHAHVDHMAGVIAHCATRDMQGMTRPTYVMPTANVAAFGDLLDVWRHLDGSDFPCSVVGLATGQRHDIRPGLWATAHATEHRVASQGYVISERRDKLKDRYKGLPGRQLAQLRRTGTVLTDATETPLVAFTGDARIEIIDRVADFRRARLLIMEVTFLDDRVSVQATRDKGHIHLDEVIQRAESFKNQAILFTHRSARYSPRQAAQIVADRLPPGLRERVTVL